ncbi:MFS transporter [Bifidobacterium pseudolongum]|uniref:MFS transporter n=1 Tax=Bifidobacterium pseudolongum TaxID=1694 RepID=UPI0022E59857|nr:MFS transporter [Bifidobacterium pseudolongum]
MNRFSDVWDRSRAWLARVFISRPFSRVLAGQVVSVTGSNATAVVIPLIAVITLDASSFEVGVLNAAESLAAAVLGIHIGRWCDCIGPDRTMLVSNLTGAVATIGLFAVLHAGVLSFPLLLALLLVVGLAELGFDISRTGYTVSLVPKDRLPHANALIEGANAVGEGIGPSVGGWLFGTVGAALSLLFDFVTYMCSSLLVLLNVLERRKRKMAATAEYTPRQDESPHDESDENGDGEVLSGLRFVWGNGIIRSIAFSAGQFNFFTAAFFTIYYVFVVRVLHMDPVAVGLAATCSGIGGIVSSVVAGTLIRRMASGPLFIGTLLSPALAALLVPLSALEAEYGNAAVLALVCISQFVWSFTVTVNLVLSESIKQVTTPERLLGQVSSVERVIALTAEPVGALAGGLFAEMIGEDIALYLCAAGLAASTAWALGGHGILSFRKPDEWQH